MKDTINYLELIDACNACILICQEAESAFTISIDACESPISKDCKTACSHGAVMSRKCIDINQMCLKECVYVLEKLKGITTPEAIELIAQVHVVIETCNTTMKSCQNFIDTTLTQSKEYVEIAQFCKESCEDSINACDTLIEICS